MSGGVLAAEAARAVDIDAIERELHDLLFAPAGEEGAAAAVATRACMSNLLVWASSGAEAAQIEDDVREIAERHPSRILLLVGGAELGDGSGDLDAYVSAVCHLGEGGRRLCSEHVVLQARPSALHRLPSVARTLLIGDLPTSLWWASTTPPARAGELFAELRDMAGQLIFDSESFPQDRDTTVDLVEWARRIDRREVVSDVAWVRLEPWRGVLIQTLDPSILPGALRSLREVEIEHAPHGLSAALLLFGWLGSRLRWSLESSEVGDESHARWSMRSASGGVELRARRASSGSGLLRVRLRWGDGDTADELEVATVDGRRLSTIGPGGRAARVLGVVEPERAALLARQLADLGGDPVYREALEGAAALARAMASR